MGRSLAKKHSRCAPGECCCSSYDDARSCTSTLVGRQPAFTAPVRPYQSSTMQQVSQPVGPACPGRSPADIAAMLVSGRRRPRHHARRELPYSAPASSTSCSLRRYSTCDLGAPAACRIVFVSVQRRAGAPREKATFAASCCGNRASGACMMRLRAHPSAACHGTSTVGGSSGPWM
jgi:hypothetical protein